MPENGAIVTTIVSSNMAKAVAKAYDVYCPETLTDFKYIGEQIKFFEENNSYEYLFGFEESYGCLVRYTCKRQGCLCGSDGAL